MWCLLQLYSSSRKFKSFTENTFLRFKFQADRKIISFQVENKKLVEDLCLKWDSSRTTVIEFIICQQINSQKYDFFGRFKANENLHS